MATVKDIRGTQTEKNVLSAYLAESSAYTRYTFYARQAEKENYFPIARIFNDTAANEFNHSKVFFKMLQGGNITIPVNADSGVIADTASNLATAAHEEVAEAADVYMASADMARKEGFDEIADHFEAIAKVERFHNERFMRYLKMVKDGTVWKRDQPIKWRCLVCGFVYEGTEPPQACPGCDHPYQHYMALEDYC